MDENVSRALLEGMGDMATLVAMLAGIRQQFIDAGWSAAGAEQATLMLMSQMHQEQ